MRDVEKFDFDAAFKELPIFPLPQVVLFPRAMLPLNIFEPRYRAMLKDALSTHRAMAIVLLEEGAAQSADDAPIHTVAGAGLIVEHQEMPDGRSNIMLHGMTRVRLEELPFVPPYRRAKATALKDLPGVVSASDRTSLMATASAFAGDVHKRDPNFSFRVPSGIEPQTLADLCAHHLIIDAHVRQSILEQLDPVERVRIVTTELASQHASLSKESGRLLH